jgi:hypothetical protein
MSTAELQRTTPETTLSPEESIAFAGIVVSLEAMSGTIELATSDMHPKPSGSSDQGYRFD